MEVRYRAIAADGRTVEGEIDAASEAAVVEDLRRRQLVPIELEAKVTRGRPGGAVPASRRVRSAHLGLVLRELSTMIGAGVQLAEAVENVALAHRIDRIGPSFADLGRRLRAGEPFAVALRSVGLPFPEYVYVLARSGELTGKLPQSLADAAAQMEYDEQVRQDARNALVYPAILVLAGIVAVAVVFAVVVPRFAPLLSNPRADLPFISVAVLRGGVFARDHWPWLAAALTVFVATAALALRSPGTRLRILNLAARLPVLGPWVHASNIATWSSVLAALIGNRVPIIEALDQARESVALRSLRHRLDFVGRDVQAGVRLAEALETHRVVDATSISLVRVGERSGELAAMLSRISRYWSEINRNRMKRLLALLEPAAILLIGTAIGFIMFGVMLAITSLSNLAV
jgi:general secretion pathway protein F